MAQEYYKDDPDATPKAKKIKTSDKPAKADGTNQKEDKGQASELNDKDEYVFTEDAEEAAEENIGFTKMSPEEIKQYKEAKRKDKK
jgi:hypothetical protein